MMRFNTLFLLKATAVTAACCVPMAINKESGFVWTAFLLPISLAWLAANEVAKRGPHRLSFKELPDSVVEIYATGGRPDQWFTRGRIIAAGGCLSVVVGFPMLNVVDQEPIGFWLPFDVLFAVGAVVLVGYSARRRVLTEERQFVTDYLLFGRFCYWRRRWQVRNGDYLAAFANDQAEDGGIPEIQFWHGLFVCRERRRHLIAGMYTSDRDIPDMEAAAHRVAKLVNLPYEGYRESRALWWPR